MAKLKLVALALACSMIESFRHSFLPSIRVSQGAGTKTWAKIKVTDWASSVAEERGFLVDGKVMTAEELAAADAAMRELKKPQARQQFPMELFVKAGPSGALGDCPFAHSVAMVLAFKGVPHTLTPCTPDNKPTWLVDGYSGSMPCLLHDGEAHTDSLVIARYLNFFTPEPALEPFTAATDAACAPLFPALASFIKNTDSAADVALETELVAALATLNTHLEKGGGGLYLGESESLGLADCSLAPKLWHLQVAGAHFKGFKVCSTCYNRICVL
jgi:glutathione S-transferase